MVAMETNGGGTGQGGACRILLIDRHRLFREALGTLLRREKEYVVVGDTGDGKQALDLLGVLKPDVVVTDLQAGGDSSVSHLEEIHARFPDVALLVLTAFRAHGVAARVKKAGALGYLLKDHGHREFLNALRAVAAGRGYRPGPGRRVRTRARLVSDQGACAAVTQLTERQRQVLRSLALGHRTRETASMLGVSVKAVHRQRERIREALRLDSVAALTRFALREGIAEGPPPSPS